MRKPLLALLIVSSPACKQAAPPAECPQAPAAAASAEKLGSLTQEARDMALKDPSTAEFELLVDPDGHVWKIYAEHKAGTPVPPGLQEAASKLWPGFTEPEYVTENTAKYGRLSLLAVKNASGESCKVAVEEGAGKIVYTQCKLPTDKLPQFIRDIGKAKFPDAEFNNGGHREFAGGSTEFWLNIKTGGKEHFIQYTAEQKPVRHGIWYEGEVMLELPL